MHALARYLIFIGSIWVFEGAKTTQISSAQDIDLPTLVAGMNHYDSLVRTGTGTCIYESSPAAQERKLVAVFTFDGRKMRADIIEGLEAGNRVVFNGEFQITSTPRLKRYTKQNRSTIDPFIDPRYWMNGAELFYLEKSLGEHLEQHPSEILRQESVEKIPCYVVDVSVHDTVRHLWIAPEMGFRLIKIYAESWSPVHAKRIQYNFRLFYTEHKTDGKTFWFPKKVKYEAIDPNASDGKELGARGERMLFENTFKVEDFKVNVPVSSAFELNIPKGTLIHDSASNTYIPVEKILKCNR